MPEPTPVPPRMTSFFLASSMSVTPVVCQVKITSFSEPVEPSQLNLLGVVTHAVAVEHLMQRDRR